jgi:hypothetical protein
MIEERSPAHRLRRWGGGVGFASGALVAAATIAMASAHADDADELLGQAGSDLTQATQVLDQIPTSLLDANQASSLAELEKIQTGPELQLLDALETYQASLPTIDQSSPLLLGADEQLVHAVAGLLDADQGFLGAADAGELGSQGATAFSADLPLIDALFGVFGADLNAGLADFVLDPGAFLAF